MSLLPINRKQLHSTTTWPAAAMVMIAWLLPFDSNAQSEDQSRYWQEIAAADKSFSERSSIIGRTQAFLEFLHEGSVVFRDGPVDAKELYSSEAVPNDSLSWKAHYIDVSRAGDLGLSVGPYVLDAGSGQQFFGHLVSIWRKDESSWQLMADMAANIPGYLGLEVEANIADTASILAETAHPVMARRDSNTLDSLIEADLLFGRSINFRGGQRALLRYGLDNTRVYLPGMAPAVGAQAASSVYGAFLDNQLSTTNPVSLSYIGGYLSESKEMGFTYGVMNSGSDEGSAGFRTNYMRLWRLSQSNEWRIAVEVLNPY